MLTEYGNKYIDSSVSNQTLINEIMSFNPVQESLNKGKTLDPFLRELLAEQSKCICLNKTLSNLQQRIAFVYGPLTKIWTAMETEKESDVADQGESNSLLERPKLFDQLIYFLDRLFYVSCIRSFNVFMSFVGDQKIVESMLKYNATAFAEAENMLFGPKYEKLIAKSKKFFGSIKNQGPSKEGNRRQPFRKGSVFRTRGNRERGTFTTAAQTLRQQYPTGGQFPCQGKPGGMSDSRGKAFYTSFVALGLGFLQLLWSLQSY